MQKRIRTGLALSLGLLFVSAGADPAGFSGRWKINLARSSFEEIYPETYPETVLEIKLDGANLSVRKTSLTRSGGRVGEKRYTTEGKVLTIVQKLDFPNGRKTITLVFERA